MTGQASFDTWTIIFLLAAVHGFVIAGLLFFHKRGNIHANNILALIMLLFAISMVYYVLYWTGYAYVFTWSNNWVDPIPYLYGPLLYYYLVTLNENKQQFKLKWHLFPFVLHCLFKIPFIIREIFNKPEWLREYFFKPLMPYLNDINVIFIIGQCVSLSVYAILMYQLVQHNKKTITTFAIPEEITTFKWLRNTWIFFVIFSIGTISYWVLVFVGWLKIEYDYAISVIMTAFIYLVGYYGFRQPSLFSDRIVMHDTAVSEPVPPTPIYTLTTSESGYKKYKNSSLKAETALALKTRLLELMHTEKWYCDNTLKIQDLAVKLEVSTHHLSQVINELCGQTWSDFIMEFRIEAAKQLLADPNYGDKILAIAFDCGFNNKATFNAAFKKMTGLSPSSYRKQATTKATG
ncbi:MAG TPA: helix-turn-helix domain-containing protein [Chitinophagales bacterium]|nr:helix-turn-helix domain-containing protein [Chitinophagales bacterium]HRG85824.1 helix-turn-helix domain-containing protein [Chitinophagales bacterium]HRH54093.1 helix-turn-helix domain-containing protein [Chitinophagales bacterium]